MFQEVQMTSGAGYDLSPTVFEMDDDTNFAWT